MIYIQFFHYCKGLGTTPLRDFNENIHESWINASSDSERQVSQLKKKEKWPTNVLRKFKKHECQPYQIKTNRQTKNIARKTKRKNTRDD